MRQECLLLMPLLILFRDHSPQSKARGTSYKQWKERNKTASIGR